MLTLNYVEISPADLEDFRDLDTSAREAQVTEWLEAENSELVRDDIDKSWMGLCSAADEALEDETVLDALQGTEMIDEELLVGATDADAVAEIAPLLHDVNIAELAMSASVQGEGEGIPNDVEYFVDNVKRLISIYDQVASRGNAIVTVWS